MSPAFNGEAIHKMRTTVKKMRALSDWSGRLTEKIFRKYYKAAGKIRNVQLLLNKINDGGYSVPEGFKDWLESLLQQLKDKWQEIYDEEKVNKQFRKLKKMLHHKKQHKHAVKFASEKNDKINLFKNERPLNDKLVHTGRKIIKEIDFLNKWENKNSDESMKKISEETGCYMDRCSEIKLLSVYIDEETDESKRNEAVELLAKWEKNKESDKIKLLESIESLPC